MLFQIISLGGAGALLAGYLSLQRGWLRREDRLYNLLNLVGSALLLWVAIVDRRIGFIVLEAVWALISIPPLLKPPATVAPAAPR